MHSSELLTTEEMSALLPDNGNAGTAASGQRRKIVPYNFRRPDRLSKEQVRSLYLLHDLFSHGLSSSLPLFLRTGAEITLISVEQQSYADYLKGLSDPTTIFTIGVQPLRGVIAIETSSAVTFPIVDRMLGGAGENVSELRAATEIELRILEGFIAVVCEAWRDAWKPIAELETEIIGCETRPQLLQIVSPNEVVVTVAFQIQVGEAAGSMSFCLPVAMLDPVIEKFNQSPYSQVSPAPPEQIRSLLKNLSNVRFPIAAELQKVRAFVPDLLELTVGDVLRTNHRVEQPVNLNIGDKNKFLGRLAALDGQIIVQVTEALKRDEKAVAAAASAAAAAAV